VPTATKVELINQLSRTGLHKIEVTSFVSPKAVPALADANEVLAGIERVPGVIYVALGPEHPRVQNAAATAKKADEVNASSPLPRPTIAPTSTARYAQSLARAADDGEGWRTGAGHEDHHEPVDHLRLPLRGPRCTRTSCSTSSERFRDAGFDGISLADTTGHGQPAARCRAHAQGARANSRRPDDTYYTLHFHNTRGMGLANVVAGIERACAPSTARSRAAADARSPRRTATSAPRTW
jgi:hydroxymethylglutaryl-CoA lyase